MGWSRRFGEKVFAPAGIQNRSLSTRSLITIVTELFEIQGMGFVLIYVPVKLKARKALRRPTCYLQNNIKMGIKEVGCEGVEFIKLSRAIQYIDQQMHLIKDNKIQSIQIIHDKYHPFKFRHRSVFFCDCTDTVHHKFSTPLQALIFPGWLGPEVELISFTPVRKVRPSLHGFLRKSQCSEAEALCENLWYRISSKSGRKYGSMVTNTFTL